MDDLDIRVLQQAQQWQASGLPVLLVTVARTWGSSPRPPGSLMALNSHGATVGSVSGGCIEDDLIARVREAGTGALCPDGRPTVLRYGISADQAHRFGLPCGGSIALVLEPVGSASRLPELLQACRQRRSTERQLCLRSGAVTLQPGRRDGVPTLSAQQLLTYFGPRYRLLLIGAGDLARLLCPMALALQFDVLICDPRGEPGNPDPADPAAAPAEAWPDGVALSRAMPDDLVRALQPDARTAVVALTHDPKLDDLALIEALQSDAFYVGAIGSRRHAALRRERLREHFDLDNAQLAALHCPVGLYIGSKTPAEIALSIMAELVAAKNGVAAHQRQALPVAEGKNAAPDSPTVARANAAGPSALAG